MAINTDLIKELRERTGVSIALCKKALEEAGGDITQAEKTIQKSSAALAAKKEGRTTGAGIVEAYIHGNKQVGVLLELRSETDFVARTPEFQSLAHEIALQIASMSPVYITAEHIPPEARHEARALVLKEVQGLHKPAEVIEKIVEGKIEAQLKEVCLLHQPYVKNPDVTIHSLIQEASAKFGEKIEVTRFVRFAL